MKGIEPMQNEQGVYAKLVAEVKADFAKQEKPHTGEQVSHAIAKRWARMHNRKLDVPVPTKPEDVPKSTTAPTATSPDLPGGVQERKPGDLRGIKLPDEGDKFDED